MNLITGKLMNGSFNTDGIQNKWIDWEDKEGDVTLGFRAEDAEVVDREAELEC